MVVVLVVLAALSGLALAAMPGIGVEAPLALVVVAGIAAAFYLIEPLRPLKERRR